MVILKKDKKNRKLWFRVIKKILRLFIKKPVFVYLGEKPKNQSIILSNHVGASGPLKLELYFEGNFRFWGTHEMNDGLISTYKYLSYTYFHQKKGWNLVASRIFCLIAAPLLNLFYKGLRLIPTYNDVRLKNTLKTSLQEMQDGSNVIIFPEDSHDGYHDKLKGFYAGFSTLANLCLKHGIDTPVYLAYYNRHNKTFTFDKPILYSELKSLSLNKNQLSKKLLDRMNELGTLPVAEKVQPA